VKNRTETTLEELAVRRDTHSRGRECKKALPARPAASVNPKKYPKEIRVRLTADEYEALIERAKSAEMSLSRCIVEHALGDIDARLDSEMSGYELYMEREWAIFLVACAGSKLNKFAKRLNAQRGTMNLNKLEEALLETKTALEQLAILYTRRDR
jgi:hypothetical protein